MKRKWANIAPIFSDLSTGRRYECSTLRFIFDVCVVAMFAKCGADFDILPP